MRSSYHGHAETPLDAHRREGYARGMSAVLPESDKTELPEHLACYLAIGADLRDSCSNRALVHAAQADLLRALTSGGPDAWRSAVCAVRRATDAAPAHGDALRRLHCFVAENADLLTDR